VVVTDVVDADVAIVVVVANINESNECAKMSSQCALSSSKT